MSKLGVRGNSLTTVGTAVLGSLCLGGAVVYTAVVGASFAAESGIRTEAAAQTMSGLSELPEPPVATLEVRVDDGEEIYEQQLHCSGDPSPTRRPAPSSPPTVKRTTRQDLLKRSPRERSAPTPSTARRPL